jgi:FAD:protein FMN transferase
MSHSSFFSGSRFLAAGLLLSSLLTAVDALAQSRTGAPATQPPVPSTKAPTPSAPTPPAATAAAPAKEAKLLYTGQAMGTIVQLTFWTDDEPAAAKAAEAVFAEMKRLDALMTTWTPDSEVSRINKAAGGEPVVVSAETFKVIAKAQEVAIATKGVFDITVGAYKGLWKFDEDMDGKIPDSSDVQKRKKLVGYKDMLLRKKKRSVQLTKKGMAITLGGIAKGYAIDKCTELLQKLGFSDFIVQAGGDMYVSGKKTEQPWVVGIRDPRGPRESSFAIAPIEDHSFSTSGDYERAFILDGKRYHHILDPRTAKPATETRSVTIRAKDAFTADAWSKVLFIKGWKASQPLIAKMKDFEAVFVDKDNEVHITKGLESTLKVLKQPTPGI